MSLDRTTILASLDTRLDSMTRAPRTWGGPEALEIAMLCTLEFRSMVGRPTAHGNEVRELWWAFINRKARRAYNSPLWCWYDGKRPGLHDHAVAQFIKLAREQLPLEVP